MVITISPSYTPSDHQTYASIVNGITLFDLQHRLLDNPNNCSDPETKHRIWTQEGQQDSTTGTTHLTACNWPRYPPEEPHHGLGDDADSEGWFGTIDWDRLDAVTASLQSNAESDNKTRCDCGMGKAAASSVADSSSISGCASENECLALFRCPSAYDGCLDKGFYSPDDHERDRDLAMRTEEDYDSHTVIETIESKAAKAVSHTRMLSSIGKKESQQSIKLDQANASLEMDPSSVGGHIIGSQMVPGQSGRKARQDERVAVPGKPKRSYRKVQSGEIGFYRGDGETFIPIGARPIRGHHKSAMLKYQKEAEEERGRITY